ncbi:MAG: ferritin family protein [Thermodesulfovibrionales bacterium]
MERYSIREVVEQALRTERLGYEFYTTMKERFKDDERFTKLFSTLAEKELAHEKRFSELLGIIKDEEPENWEEASEYLRAIVESEFFLGKDKALPALAHVKSIDDAVEFAIGFEKETLLYFYGLLGSVKEKEVIEEIISEEKSHIKWLMAFKESFKK